MMSIYEKQWLDLAEKIGSSSPGEFKCLINREVMRSFQLVASITKELDGKPLVQTASWLLSIVVGGAVTCGSAGGRKVAAAMLRKAAELVEAEGEVLTREEVSN
jgi:hypothetical protein